MADIAVVNKIWGNSIKSDTDIFKTGDLLVSNNGIFCATLDNEGFLRTYRSPSPSDDSLLGTFGEKSKFGSGIHCMFLQKAANLCIYRGVEIDWHLITWCLGSNRLDGSYVLILHDDGNLCIYDTLEPDPNKRLVKCFGITDPIDQIIKITNITYHLNQGKIVRDEFDEIYSQIISNESHEPQTSTISGSKSIIEEKGWSIALGYKVGASVEMEFSSGLPLIASISGKITISAEVNNEYSWNGSKSIEKTISFETPVTVPPGKIYQALIHIGDSKIEVPYTMECIVRLKSGAQASIILEGTYLGNNLHDLMVDIFEYKPNEHNQGNPMAAKLVGRKCLPLRS